MTSAVIGRLDVMASDLVPMPVTVASPVLRPSPDASVIVLLVDVDVPADVPTALAVDRPTDDTEAMPALDAAALAVDLPTPETVATPSADPALVSSVSPTASAVAIPSLAPSALAVALAKPVTLVVPADDPTAENVDLPTAAAVEVPADAPIDDEMTEASVTMMPPIGRPINPPIMVYGQVIVGSSPISSAMVGTSL